MLNFNILLYPTQANTGGLLGLCMGFSVLSLLEILYYGSLRLFCSYYRDKAIRDKNMDSELNSVVSVSSQPPNYYEAQAAVHPKQAWFSQMHNGTSSDINRNKIF